MANSEHLLTNYQLFTEVESLRGQVEDLLNNNPSNGTSNRYLGEVFSSLSAEPHEGAFLLNGQTIYECRETYKEF